MRETTTPETTIPQIEELTAKDEATIDNTEASKQLDAVDATVCGMYQLSLHEHQSEQSPTTPVFDLPLELVAKVLDFLPQHQVYPFLSLSKGVNFIATQRLLRRVVVLKEGVKPFLHDVVDELYHWLFLTNTQYRHLLRHNDKWPGQVIIYDQLSVTAIGVLLNPAENFYPDMFKSRIENFCSVIIKPPTVFVDPGVNREFHLAWLTLIEVGPFDPLATKFRVDNLLIFGNVRGIEGCINLSLVKQLSLVGAFCKEHDDIYQIVPKFTGLKDLFIAETNGLTIRLHTFPQTVRRLVLNWPYAHEDNAIHFRSLLEYLELGRSYEDQNWPRRLTTQHSFVLAPSLVAETFPRLKTFVRDSVVYIINRTPNEGFTEKKVRALRRRDDGIYIPIR